MNYDGDYRCQSNDGPEDPCRRIATKCYREPFTPGHFPMILCDEHTQGVAALGYDFDAQATAQLSRDIEREAERSAA